ncbi:pyridoxal phosphate-dependent aminotransferase [Yunchengibacter salinarum]|uniref:pyridoxal phosphate-dependent aminotransferase n=1 Tax=Yunchengibacter salinarum TaxID=3133399 RepID=UPI0035B69724
MTALAERLDHITASATMAITARAAAMRASGVDVIPLSAGEPDLPVPDPIKKAAVDAIMADRTGYTAVDGLPALKQAVADKFSRDNALYAGPDQVSVNSGGKHTLFTVFMASLRPGDRVIVPAPYWVSTPAMVRLADGIPDVVPTSAETGFKLTPDALEAAITHRTRWLVLNSPGNPTGAVYTAAELAALGAVLARHPHIWVLSDDIYEHLTFTADGHSTLAAICPDLASRTVTMNGVSKAYGMTGWRIGYCTGPKALIDAMATVQSHSTGNPCTISQIASLAALTGDQTCLAERRAVYQARRDMVMDALPRLPGLSALRPDGAFYIFLDARALIGASAADGTRIEDDTALTRYLLEHAHVALVPGTAFGLGGHVRLSVTAAESRLATALDRLATACNGLR